MDILRIIELAREQSERRQGYEFDGETFPPVPSVKFYSNTFEATIAALIVDALAALNPDDFITKK